MTGRTIGKYQILSEIGRGGMAVVYLGLDPAFQRQVAIKVLPTQYLENPLLRARFEREARIIATLEHPAIVPVHDFGEQDGQLYMVMRFMPGGSLADKIRHGALPPAEAVDILAHLAPALDGVHARGIVHRDLKPANILFDAFGNPALSDFGIAQLTEATVDLTGEAVIGTPSYMSPEQVRSDVPIDGRSDVYALGVILYEMLTGRQPYRAATPMSLAMKHLTEPVPQIHSLLPQFPPELDTVLARALAKDREQRYPRAAAMVADLRSLPPLPARPIGETVVDVVETPSKPANPAPRPAAPPAPSSPRLTPTPVPTGGQTPSGQMARPAKTGPLPANPPTLTVKNPWLVSLGATGVIGLVGVCVLVVLGYMAYRAGIFGGRIGADATPPPTREAAQASGDVAAPQGSDGPLETPATASPQLPAVTPIATRLVLEDNFSNQANGWPEGAEARIKYRYAGNAYRLNIEDLDTLYWASPDGEYGDVVVSVKGSIAAGGGESYFGLVCRLKDNNNFYYLVARIDGYYTIGKIKDGQFNSLLSDGWVYNDQLAAATQPYALRAECIDSSLRLFLGNVLLGQAQDTDFTTGGLGLAAAAIGNPVEVIFDDFSIGVPE